MYTSSDTRLEWPRKGPLFEADSNKRRGPNGATIRVASRHHWSQACGPWIDMAPARKPYVGDLNRCIFHLTQGWNGLGRGHTSRSRINARGSKLSYYSSYLQAIIEVRPKALVQIWHPPDHKWETGTGVSSIWPKIGMTWGGAIIRVGFEEMQGPKCGHYSLGHYLFQAWGPWHQCKSLSYVAEYVYQICRK